MLCVSRRVRNFPTIDASDNSKSISDLPTRSRRQHVPRDRRHCCGCAAASPRPPRAGCARRIAAGVGPPRRPRGGPARRAPGGGARRRSGDDQARDQGLRGGDVPARARAGARGRLARRGCVERHQAEVRGGVGGGVQPDGQGGAGRGRLRPRLQQGGRQLGRREQSRRPDRRRPDGDDRQRAGGRQRPQVHLRRAAADHVQHAARPERQAAAVRRHAVGRGAAALRVDEGGLVPRRRPLQDVRPVRAESRARKLRRNSASRNSAAHFSETPPLASRRAPRAPRKFCKGL